jgi:hypothetical protein
LKRPRPGSNQITATAAPEPPLSSAASTTAGVSPRATVRREYHSSTVVPLRSRSVGTRDSGGGGGGSGSPPPSPCVIAEAVAVTASAAITAAAATAATSTSGRKRRSVEPAKLSRQRPLRGSRTEHVQSPLPPQPPLPPHQRHQQRQKHGHDRDIIAGAGLGGISPDPKEAAASHTKPGAPLPKADRGWTQDELMNLRALVQRDGEGNWERKGAELGRPEGSGDSIRLAWRRNAVPSTATAGTSATQSPQKRKESCVNASLPFSLLPKVVGTTEKKQRTQRAQRDAISRSNQGTNIILLVCSVSFLPCF